MDPQGVEVVTAAELVGIGVVDRPAYPSATVEARDQRPAEDVGLPLEIL